MLHVLSGCSMRVLRVAQAWPTQASLLQPGKVLLPVSTALRLLPATG